MESIIKDKIIKYSNTSLAEAMQGQVSLTNISEFFESINNHTDRHDLVDKGVFDFQKACNMVLHQRHLSKISSHEIRGEDLL